MADTRRLNHWVPVSYLAAFTSDGTEDGLLTIYDREKPGSFLSLPPRAVAAERDLYVVPLPDGGKDDEIERMLATLVEKPFLFVRNKLVYGPDVWISRRLTGDERAALATFVAFQHMRTPHNRSMFNSFIKFQMTVLARGSLLDPEERLERYRRATGNEVTLLDAKKWLRAMDDEDMILEPNEKLWLGPFLGNVMKIAEVIAELPMQVVDAPAGVRFITSDHPVSVVRRALNSMEWRYGGGWLERLTEAVFPLSPSVALVFGQSLPLRKDVGSVLWSDGVTRRSAEGCSRWAYSSEPDDRVERWLKNSKTPEWRIRYPGGEIKPGDSIQKAVRDMMEKNPGSATVAFGRAD